jgi:tRNA A-37 threonylcarbamoyl transferase component Bud32
LIKIPEEYLTREAKWAFANQVQAMPSSEYGLQFSFFAYLTSIVRAVMFMMGDDAVELELDVESASTTLQGQRIDIVVLQVLGKKPVEGTPDNRKRRVIMAVEMKVTGSWPHTDRHNNPIPLHELERLAKKLESKPKTVTLRYSMIGPTRQLKTYLVDRELCYGMLSTGKDTYLCRRPTATTLEARMPLSLNGSGQSQAQGIAHFLIHVLMSKDQQMPALTEEEELKLISLATDDTRSFAGTSVKGASKNSGENKSNGKSNGKSKGNGKSNGKSKDNGKSNGKSKGKSKRDNTSKVSVAADGTVRFGGFEVEVPPGVDVVTALHLEFNEARGDTSIIGDFHTGPAYRVTFEDEPVVVKIANTDKDKYLRPKIENEKRVYEKLKELQGDVVPRLVYAGPMLGGRSAIATSDCGLSLDEWAKTATSTEFDAVATEARVKLRRLHDAGVLHGDVRSQNITIDKARKVSIIDFGFATELSGEDERPAEEECSALEGDLTLLGDTISASRLE